MYKIILLVSFVCIGCQGATLDKHECAKLFHPRSWRCCNENQMTFFFNHDSDIKECFRGHKKPPKSLQELDGPPPCDREMCIAEKKRFLNDDGTINKDMLKDVIEKVLKDKPTLVSGIIEKCIERDLDQYAPPDFCDLHKLKHCMVLQSFNNCREWDEENPDCDEIKDLVEECTN